MGLTRQRIFLTITCLVLASARAGQVFAFALADSKPTVEETLAPGQSVQGSIQLTNTSDNPMDINIHLEDWQYTTDGDGSKTFGPPGTLPRSASTWISFAPPRVTLPPQGSARIDYTVRVPEDSSLEGGYYSVLFFESIVAQGAVTPLGPDVRTAYVDYVAKLGSLFLIEIRNTARHDASLQSLSVSPPAGGPMVIRGYFASTGNTVVRCDGGSFHLQSADGLIAARGELPGRYTWPGQQVPLLAQWSGTLASGTYDLVLTYDCGNDFFVTDEVSVSVP